MSFDESWRRCNCALVSVDGRVGVGLLQCNRLVEPLFSARGRYGRGLALDDTQRTIGRIALECEQILSGLRLPEAAPFLDDDPIGHRTDAETGERHRLGQLPAQLFQRAG